MTVEVEEESDIEDDEARDDARPTAKLLGGIGINIAIATTTAMWMRSSAVEEATMRTWRNGSSIHRSSHNVYVYMSLSLSLSLSPSGPWVRGNGAVSQVVGCRLVRNDRVKPC